jgi:hypothetical protein
MKEKFTTIGTDNGSVSARTHNTAVAIDNGSVSARTYRTEQPHVKN